MNIDDEIEYFKARIEELVHDRQNAASDEDWDRVDFFSDKISLLESELDALYEQRDMLP